MKHPKVIVKARFILAAAAIVFASAAATAPTPYAGQQTRHIKALSAKEVQGYLAGEGLGSAKAGELNHYPGPRHVLDLAKALHLTAAQHQQTTNLFERMHFAAVPLGRQIVAKERQLDVAFSNGSINDASLSAQTADIATLEGQLRDVHLSAHLVMRRVLTRAQVAAYDRLRGYDKSGNAEMHGMTM